MQLLVDEETPVIIAPKMSLVHTQASIQENLGNDAPVVVSTMNEQEASLKESAEETPSNYAINDSDNKSSVDSIQDISHKEQKDKKLTINSSEDCNNYEERYIYNNKKVSQIELNVEERSEKTDEHTSVMQNNYEARCIYNNEDIPQIEPNVEERSEITDENPSFVQNNQESSFEKNGDAAPKQHSERVNLENIDNDDVSQKGQNDKQHILKIDNILPGVENNLKLPQDSYENISTIGHIANNIYHVSLEKNKNRDFKIDEVSANSKEIIGLTEKNTNSNNNNEDLNSKTKIVTTGTDKNETINHASVDNKEEITVSGCENIKDSDNLTNTPNNVNLEVNDSNEGNTLKSNNSLNICTDSFIDKVDQDGDEISKAIMNQSAKKNGNSFSLEKTFEYSMEQDLTNDIIMNDINNDCDADNISTIKNSVSKECSTDESNLLDNQPENTDKIECASNNDNDKLSFDMEIDNAINLQENKKNHDNNCPSKQLPHKLEQTTIDCRAENNEYDNSHSIHEDIVMGEKKKDPRVPTQASKEDDSNNLDEEKALSITNEEKNGRSSESFVLITSEVIELDKTVEASEGNEKYKDKEVTEKTKVVSEKKIQEISDKADDSATNCRKDKIEKHPTENEIPKKSMLANNLEIFSVDEDDRESPLEKNVIASVPTHPIKSGKNKKCVSLIDDDDDDIMVIDDDTSLKNEKESSKIKELEKTKDLKNQTQESENSDGNSDIVFENVHDKAESTGGTAQDDSIKTDTADETTARVHKNPDSKPLVTNDFLNNFKTKMSEMTRNDLEEFCVLKIVEGVIDRSNLSEIKAKLKTMMQNVEEWRKKAMVLNKQNRDLQIVMRTIQEEQKKKLDEVITPLKITRSVGMQVLMSENKSDTGRPRNQKRSASAIAPHKNTSQKQYTKTLKAPIPVPRLVPAASPTKPVAKPSSQVQNSTVTSNSGSTKPTVLNGIKPNTPIKVTKKRSFSDAIDLTDDEPAPPMKKQPVRLVPPQQLMAPGRSAMAPNSNNTSPRQVYIPIGSQSIKPGQTIVFKNALPANRMRGPTNPSTVVRGASPSVRPAARSQNKHPAPLPQAHSQPQPPNWKALPPAPDLKISKIENGIVVSWKIDGYQESSCEEIVSYQLYAYQETSAPASTFLWNKIGDIKALPLPMACTLTQFIAGYKYYFAVRAVDVKSRIGPFSLPGSILLLNK